MRKRLIVLSVMLGWLLAWSSVFLSSGVYATPDGDADIDDSAMGMCSENEHYDHAPDSGLSSWDAAVLADIPSLQGLTPRTIDADSRAYERWVDGRRVEAFQVWRKPSGSSYKYIVVEHKLAIPCP